MELTEVMKALADTNRLRILNLLGDQTLCVCDLEDVLRLNQSNLSRHLAKLKQAGLISARKQGLFAYYSRRALPEPYNRVVEEVCNAMLETKEWAADRQALTGRSACSPVLLPSG
jgi:ArsR family transcriptional regulator